MYPLGYNDVMEIEVEFYIAPNGHCPFKNWIEDINDHKTRAKILGRIGRLRLGSFGDCKSLGDGVAELRIDYGAGIRMYYSKIGNTVILLLCGGTKRSQDKDVQTVKEYLKEYHLKEKRK